MQTNQFELDLIKFYVEWVKVRALHKPTRFFHIQAGGHSSNLEEKVGFIYQKMKKAKKFSIKYINYTDDDLTLLSST